MPSRAQRERSERRGALRLLAAAPRVCRCEPLYISLHVRPTPTTGEHLQRLPSMSQAREFVEVGGLIAYGANINDLFRRSTVYVDKILKGAKPADLPVEQPTRFELVINMKTAKALGIDVPVSMQLLADEVIE